MNIYESIANIINEIGAIGKDKKNVQQGFMYRGVDDVMNALQPVLSKNKVFIVPKVLEHVREERQTQKGGILLYSVCKIEYTFYAEDGTSITAIVIGEGMDSGDKATNKAMSIAFKYACFQVFCIPTEEMPDPDADMHDIKPKCQPKPSPQEKKSQQTPAQNSDIEKRAKAIYFKLCGDKPGQLKWTKEQYTAWVKEYKASGNLTTDFYTKFTKEDIEFLEARIKEISP